MVFKKTGLHVFHYRSVFKHYQFQRFKNASVRDAALRFWA
jgi:hypothetical protein